MDFARKYQGRQFPSSSLPFLSVWLGISLGGSNPTEMFCSELMAHYYRDCLGPQYQAITGTPFDDNLTTLFGAGAPTTEDMYTPGHFSGATTPNAAVFSGQEEIVYRAYADLGYVTLQPFLIALVVLLLIWMSLPH
jgi:hypothetical protein